jgi:hypothetical protein
MATPVPDGCLARTPITTRGLQGCQLNIPFLGPTCRMGVSKPWQTIIRSASAAAAAASCASSASLKRMKLVATCSQCGVTHAWLDSLGLLYGQPRLLPRRSPACRPD